MVFAASDFPVANEHRCKVHQWLQAPSPLSNYEANQKMREPGTGLWFIEGIKYKNWKSKNGSLLWLTGGRKYLNGLVD